MKSGTFPVVEFQEKMRLNPRWSSWTCFTEILKKRNNISRRTIKKNFERLVDEDDYAKNERGKLLKFLFGYAEKKAESRKQ